MNKMYSVSELARIWEVSANTARKRVDKGEKEGLPTSYELRDNKEVKVIAASKEFIERYIDKGISNHSSQPYEPVSNQDNAISNDQDFIKTQSSTDKMLESLIEMQKEFSNTLVTMSDKHNEQLTTTYERVANAEQKLYLIEDKQKSAEADLEFYKSECFKLKQEKAVVEDEKKALEDTIKSLKEKNSQLASEKNVISEENTELKAEIERLQTPWYKRKRG